MSRRKPKPPPHLTDAAKSKWMETLPTLADWGPVSLDLLTSYATAYARMVEAEQKIAETGVVVRSSGGTAGVSPYLTVAQAERRAVRQLAEALRKRRPAKGDDESGDPILRLLTKAE